MDRLIAAAVRGLKEGATKGDEAPRLRNLCGETVSYGCGTHCVIPRTQRHCCEGLAQKP